MHAFFFAGGGMFLEHYVLSTSLLSKLPNFHKVKIVARPYLRVLTPLSFFFGAHCTRKPATTGSVTLIPKLVLYKTNFGTRAFRVWARVFFALVYTFEKG